MSACGEIVENEKNATYRVMLSLSLVILSEAKNLLLMAQDKLRETFQSWLA